MTIQESKETVVLAGRMLVESGLIARTWGNVSCRINDSHFVITPSGRDYLSLTPEEIVEVAISDCSYSGEIKPSSEKGVHAEVYKLHPDINFVIHTHQDHASCVSVLNKDSIPVPKEFSGLQGEIICAAYGLPGTKKLRKAVAEALLKSKGNAIIMKHHGALCFGVNYEEAFQVAKELEEACSQFILDQLNKMDNNSIKEALELGCKALSEYFKKPITIPSNQPLTDCESERTSKGFRLFVHDKAYDFTFNNIEKTPFIEQTMLAEIALHNEIYQNHTNINHILHSNTSGIAAVSFAGIKVLPLLDDFAQIAGASIRIASMNPKEASTKLKGPNVVFLQNNGALCCGSTKSDALAVGIVTEKNCNALISAVSFHDVRYINPIECRLMRFIYLKKYSKQAYKK